VAHADIVVPVWEFVALGLIESGLAFDDWRVVDVVAGWRRGGR